MRRASSFFVLAAIVVASAPEPSWGAGLRGTGSGTPRVFSAAVGRSRAADVRFGGRFASPALRSRGDAVHGRGRGFHGLFGYGWGGLGWGGFDTSDRPVVEPWREPDTGVVAATGIRPPPAGQPVVYVLHPERDAVAHWRASRAQDAKRMARAGRRAWSDSSDASGPEWGGAGARVIHLRVARGG